MIDLQTGKEVASRNPSKHHGLFDLIGSWRWAPNNELYAVEQIPKSGGTYMADEYTDKVINVSTGKVDPKVASTLLKKENGSDSRFKTDGFESAIVSPNGSKVALLSQEEGNSKVRFIQFKPRFQHDYKVGDIPRTAVWSADSRQCAIITSIYKKLRFDHDEIRLFDFASP